MSLADRVKEAVEACRPKNQAEVARLIGKSSATLTLLIQGQTKSMKADTAAGLERVSGFRAQWLTTGKGPKLVEINTEAGPELAGHVPLLSDVQAGAYTMHVDNFHPGDGGQELVATSVPIKRHTFALRVSGDSMEPTFPNGAVIIVEPELDPQPGDYVIAKNGDDETTFKQLVRDGGDWYLKPVNPRWPIKALGESKIVGVVRAMETRFR